MIEMIVTQMTNVEKLNNYLTLKACGIQTIVVS